MPASRKRPAPAGVLTWSPRALGRNHWRRIVSRSAKQRGARRRRRTGAKEPGVRRRLPYSAAGRAGAVAGAVAFAATAKPTSLKIVVTDPGGIIGELELRSRGSRTTGKAGWLDLHAPRGSFRSERAG